MFQSKVMVFGSPPFSIRKLADMRKLIGIAVGFIFTIVIVSFIIGGYWNYQMYQECLRDGHKSYQCKAMVNNGGYVAVEDITQ